MNLVTNSPEWKEILVRWENLPVDCKVEPLGPVTPMKPQFRFKDSLYGNVQGIEEEFDTLAEMLGWVPGRRRNIWTIRTPNEIFAFTDQREALSFLRRQYEENLGDKCPRHITHCTKSTRLAAWYQCNACGYKEKIVW